MNIVVSYDFTQSIPCAARCDFMDHVHRSINDSAVFEVTLVSHAQPDRNYVVTVTNVCIRTYFSGPGWTNLLTEYDMQYGDKIKILLGHQQATIYFLYTAPDDDVQQ